ncbi:MAG: tryptophan synthase subunit alpha [Elusimicrobiota bacterium]
MNRINKMFTKLLEEKRKGVFPFIVGGYPDIKTTGDLIRVLSESGADLLEIGVPFSDPVADGPVIQEASHEALLRGVNIEDLFTVVEHARKKTGIPIVFMSYYNPILSFGLEKTAKRAKEAGVDGFIVPDLPPEDGEKFEKILKKNGINCIYLLTINSSKQRIKLISKRSSGFIYLVSRLGVTGMSEIEPEPIKDTVKEIKKYSNIPIAVGFGVSTPAQAKDVSNIADAVIIGSAIVKTIRSAKKANILSETSKFVAKIAGSVHSK